MRELVEDGGLVAYLKKIAIAGSMVVAISSPALEVGSTFQNSYELAHIAQNHPDFFGVGPHWVDSDPSHVWKEKQSPDMVFGGYAVVWTLIARLQRDQRIIGGYRSLIEGLSSYEAIHANDPRADQGVGHLIVKLPTDPAELEKLKSLLLAKSICFSIDDGSGLIHEGNTFMGNGLYFG